MKDPLSISVFNNIIKYSNYESDSFNVSACLCFVFQVAVVSLSSSRCWFLSLNMFVSPQAVGFLEQATSTDF